MEEHIQMSFLVPAVIIRKLMFTAESSWPSVKALQQKRGMPKTHHNSGLQFEFLHSAADAANQEVSVMLFRGMKIRIYDDCRIHVKKLTLRRQEV